MHWMVRSGYIKQNTPLLQILGREQRKASEHLLQAGSEWGDFIFKQNEQIPDPNVHICDNVMFDNNNFGPIAQKIGKNLEIT